MQLILSFNLLLASLLVTLSSVDAAPLRRNTALITLPLKRLHKARDDLHPLVFHQLHLNRGHKRLARMTGRDEPTTGQLAVRLDSAVEASTAKRFNRPVPPTPKKRFNRDGLLPDKRSDINARHKKKDNTTEEIDSVIDLLGQEGAQGLEIGKNGELKLGEGGSLGNGTAQATSGLPSPTGTDLPSPAATGLPSPAVANPNEIGGGAAISAVGDGSLIVADVPTANNSLGLHVEIGDIGYSATLQVGTPPRPFLVLMDSGSADFWVGGETCQGDQGGTCGNHQFLGPTSSSSFQDSKAPWNITYGTGSVSGNIVQDTVLIGNLQLDKLTFGTALIESIEFSAQDTPFDGLMGLARSELSNQGVPTPIEVLKQKGLVQEAITSYKISRGADNLNDGEITFGGLDESKFNTQTLVTLPNVNKRGFWEASMPSITVDGKDLGLKQRTAILDTGTTLIIAPPADADAIHQAIPGATTNGRGQFTVPCNTKARVALTFGNTQFEIDPRDLAFAPVARNSPDCVSGISSVSNFGFDTEWLVGDVFLKNAYFSHDVDKNTISLAKLK